MTSADMDIPHRPLHHERADAVVLGEDCSCVVFRHQERSGELVGFAFHLLPCEMDPVFMQNHVT